MADVTGDFAGNARFEVLRLLGEGGMGVVYEALDRERGRRVALKTVRGQSGEALLALKREFRALQDLSHPNLVELHNLFEEAGRWFITMELVEGSSFIEYVRAPAAGDRDGPACDEQRLREALRCLVDGLVALHNAGKVHRDVKPANVRVTAAGRVVLLDFGLVSGTAWVEQSSTMDAAGTAAYMAPEQAASAHVGPPADWYSVGVMLYEALTGQLPFAGPALKMMMDKQTTEPTAPRSLRPGVPSDLDRLCLELLRFDPNRRPGSADIHRRLGANLGRSTPTSSRTQTPPFVGRADELEALSQAFAATRQRQTVTFLIEGESGLGKSALVQRFTERLAEAGAVVLAGRCYEREAMRYKAVDGVIDALSHHLGHLPPDEAAAVLPRSAALLGQAFPVLRRVKAVAKAPPLRGEAGIEPQELRSRLFAAVRGFLGRLADRRPLVVVIDDLQWTDADSLALLAEIVRPPDAPALLLVATVRSGLEVGLTCAEVAQAIVGDVRTRRLEPLPDVDARVLAATLMNRAAAPGDATERIAAEARGHPLFIHELVREVATRGELEARPEARPLRLDDVLWSRLAQLPPPARRILDLLAVAAAPVPQAVVAHAAGLDPLQRDRSFGLLRVANLVQGSSGRHDGLVSTYHDRIREAVAAHLSPDDRRSCHEELALALEASGTAAAQTMVVHWRGAGNAERVVACALNAAAEAEGALAFDQAAELYALALGQGLTTGEPLRRLRVALGEALRNAGRGREAAEVYLQAAASAPAVEALDLQRRAAEQYLKSGYIAEGLDAIRNVLASVGLTLPATPRRALLSLLWRRAAIRLRGLRFREREASSLAPETLARIDTCWTVASALSTVDTVRGAEFDARTLLMALRAGEPTRLVRVLATESVFTATRGRAAIPRTDWLLGLLARLATRVATTEARAFELTARGMADYFLGRFGGSAETLAQAQTTIGEAPAGRAWELANARQYRIFALTYLGHMAEVSRAVPFLAAEALRRGDRYSATYLRLSFCNAAWLVDDDVDTARRMIAEATVGWSRGDFHVQHWYDLTARTQLALYTGVGASGYAHLLTQWPGLAHSLLLRVQLVRVEAWHLRARCALAAATAPGTTAAQRDQWLGEATQLAGRMKRERTPSSVPLGDLVLAGVAASRGRREPAVTALARAIKGFDDANLALHAAVARRRLGELQGGTRGDGLVEIADVWMANQKIAQPRRWTALLAPGF